MLTTNLYIFLKRENTGSFPSKQQTPLQGLNYYLLENAFTDFGAFIVFFLFFFFLGFTLLFVKSVSL